MTEQQEIERLQMGVIRLVCQRRKRKLEKRGEYVYFSEALNSWAWEPDWVAPNPNTEDGLPWVSHSELIANTGDSHE